MKKGAIYLLVLAILLSICGCAMPSSSENTPSDKNNQSISVQLPTFSVCMPIITEATNSANGATIFISKFQDISLILPDPEIAERIIVDFLNRVDAAQSQAETIKVAAIERYDNSAQWTPYLNQIIYSPMRIDSCVLSFFGSYVSYSGGIHPETVFSPVTYDLSNGQVLSLPDILTENATADRLAELVIEELAPHKNTLYLTEDFADTVRDRFRTSLQQDTGWYFSQNGLCFYFAPYEIAPYTTGGVKVQIPYESLPGIINDSYFPPESGSGNGDIGLSPFQTDTLQRFSQFSEVIIHGGNDKSILYAEDTLYHIRITTIGTDTEGETVFAAYTLSPGDCIVLDGLNPNMQLQVSYNNGQDTFNRNIVYNSTGTNYELTAPDPRA